MQARRVIFLQAGSCEPFPPDFSPSLTQDIPLSSTPTVSKKSVKWGESIGEEEITNSGRSVAKMYIGVSGQQEFLGSKT